MFFLDFNKKSLLEFLRWTILLILLISGSAIIIIYCKEFYYYGYLGWLFVIPLMSNDESWLLFGNLKKWTKPVNKLINVMILVDNGIILLALALLSIFLVVGNN